MSNESEFAAFVKRAYVIAGQYRHELVTLEHLLSALIEDNEIQSIITNCGGDLEKLKTDLKKYLDNAKNHSIVTGGGTYQPRHTELLGTVVRKSRAQSIFSNKADMGGLDLFIALFEIDKSYASYYLQTAGLTKDKVLDYVRNKKNSSQKKLDKKDAIEILEQYCVNLNEKAKSGKIDPLIGREDIVEQITQIMARRNKHNVVLIGDPGVGKTIIVEGLAKRIVEKDVPDTLLDKTIWSVDMAAIVAGTKFRGDFEERMKQIISAFTSLEDSIMFIDEIHMIMNAGSGGQGAMDAANLLKPALSRGDIRNIGSTTVEEYRKHFEKDRALMRRYQKVMVDEPTIEDTKRILHKLSTYYSNYHGVTYEPEALDAAVDLSVKYIHDKFLPDKAIDIIDSVGAWQRIKPEAERAKSIGVAEIEAEVSRITKIPVSTTTVDDTDKLKNLEVDLKSAVFGQDHAAKELADAVLVSRSGLRSGTKTQGAYLFTGPTGVGKTEIAKQLAAKLGIAFVRFDMSEYQERHTVSTFIGSPPGYVGYGDGNAGSGLLINAIERTPYCVILCDEIEKAHPDIVNIFLQIMDYGKISSKNGKTVSARNVFLIFTSNLGAADREKMSIGFGSTENTNANKEAVNAWFAPEFRNRLDGMMTFNKLTRENMVQILDKFIKELNTLSADKKVNIGFDQSAKDFLIDKGFDPIMGARPLERVISEYVKKPLSKELLFGKLKNGGAVIFTVKDKSLDYTVMDTLLDGDNLELSQDMEEALS